MPATLLYAAWKKLIAAYLLSFAVSLLFGWLLLNFIQIAPETVFEMATKRLSYALPVMDMGAKAGLDSGLVLFIWNAAGALVTVSFIFTAAMFNPLQVNRSPRILRKFFCSPPRMRLLCFLPGCSQIDAEPLRRLYVWLMVPLIGMILLGIETGFSASTAKFIFGSYLTGIILLLPHGIVEIPAIALAGAVTFSAHLLIKPKVPVVEVGEAFRQVASHRQGLPIKKISLGVVLCLLIAGLIEAHVTPALLQGMGP